jgi:very-short-patch-repair endonuclease
VVDFFWPEHRLVLEVDSYLYHHTPKDRAEDRRKQRILEKTGHTVLRVTDDELKDTPEAAVADVAAQFSRAHQSTPASPR